MAAVVMNAASTAYRKAIKNERKKATESKDYPAWLRFVAESLPADMDESKITRLMETATHRKERLMAHSPRAYERFAWLVYKHTVSTHWFEAFIMANILLIGVATGIDLENNGRDDWAQGNVDAVSLFTTVVFTAEVVLKIITEGYEPQQFFLDAENGYFNLFDFLIVAGSFALMGSNSSGTIGALRMLRLIRLFTFVKGVPQLRVIVAGLVTGLKSVVYILMLLLLVVYLFAILGSLLFGQNDPARFGKVSISMLTLFQVSTLASWSSIAYTNWFGCEAFVAGPYDDNNPSTFDAALNHFQGFKCKDNSSAQPFITALFFSAYILLTAWVIMCLFISVISMGMFESFFEMKTFNENKRYYDALDKNQASLSSEGDEEGDSPKRQRISRRFSSLARIEKEPTLKEKIDLALTDTADMPPLDNLKPTNSPLLSETVSANCMRMRDAAWFTQVVTGAILLAGVMIGVETDRTNFCLRLEARVDGRNDDESVDTLKACESELVLSTIVAIATQAIFAVEALIKILAEGSRPERYFTDRENGGWNCLDFGIVCIGFVEITPAAFLFEAFPVVVLRLLRLLRVFRLAKALPRLRSIVEALISGFSAVGWICILIVVFNYIAACMCMLFFRDNDPFHFGSLGRSMFTILRIETLDTWDQILYLAMFGCSQYPAAYPFLSSDFPGAACDESETGYGWFGGGIFVFVSIIGAYVLPTVLVGIVAIKFDEASKFSESASQAREEIENVIQKASQALPDFFFPGRLDILRDAFELMDANMTFGLDLDELKPFYHYTFNKLFGVTLTKKLTEELFLLMDINHDTSLNFAEFVLFIVTLKQIEEKCKAEPAFEAAAFGAMRQTSLMPDRSFDGMECWARAMKRIDAEASEDAWDVLLLAINTQNGRTQEKKMQVLFAAFDSSETGDLDVSEISRGLVDCGCHLNTRQLTAFAKSLDVDGDGKITLADFTAKVKKVVEEREVRGDDVDAQKAQETLLRISLKRGTDDDMRQLDPFLLSTKLEVVTAQKRALAEEMERMGSELELMKQRVKNLESQVSKPKRGSSMKVFGGVVEKLESRAATHHVDDFFFPGSSALKSASGPGLGSSI